MTLLPEHLAAGHLRGQLEDAVMTALATGVRMDHAVAVLVDVLADLISEMPGNVEALATEALHQRTKHHVSRKELAR
jgi:hypothetical protein